MRAKNRCFQLLWLCLSAALHGCALVHNYDDPDEPRYAESYSNRPDTNAEEFVLASFNIRFADEVDRAILEIQSTRELAEAAILLLQEMDPEGTDTIARELGYDYVYYPGSKHAGQDFGNAILSRWPIAWDNKLILPHRNPANGRIRIAVSALLTTPSGPLVTYSVHTETPWLGPRARLEQVEAIANDAKQFTDPTAIGGDFNTLEAQSVEHTAGIFETRGYAWATEGLEASTTSPVGDFALDHVFVKALIPLSAETQSTEASDHQPLWVRLQRTTLP